MILPGTLYYHESAIKDVTKIVEFLALGGLNIHLQQLNLKDILVMAHGCINPNTAYIYQETPSSKAYASYNAIYGIMEVWNKYKLMWL